MAVTHPISLNILFDAYPNVEAAEASVYPFLDRTPPDVVQVSAAARAEQGNVFARRMKARYPVTEVIFRLSIDDFAHRQSVWSTPQKWFDSLAPWSAGGLLTLSVNNEPGAGGDLEAQDAWMVGIGDLLHRSGLRGVFWNLQTHNRFNPARIDGTLRMCSKYHFPLGMHYYFSEGFPIDPLHEAVEAYCVSNGIAAPDFYITELGYLRNLAPYAGYRGRIDSRIYAQQLVAPVRQWKRLKYLVFGHGNQSPWGELDISGDKTVQDEIVSANLEAAVAPPPIPAPTTGGVLVTITGFPPNVPFRNVRSQPTASAADVSDLRVNDLVTVYRNVTGAPADWAYVDRAADGVKGWSLWTGVSFAEQPVGEPPPPPVPHPTPEEVAAALEALTSAKADNAAAGVGIDNAIALIKGELPPAAPNKVTLDVPFVSQRGSDADISNNDCFVASLLMCTRFAMKSRGFLVPDVPTVDDLVPYTPLGANPAGLLTFNDAIALAKRLGFTAVYKSGLTPDALRRQLDANTPVMVLLDYSVYYLTGAKIPHILVVSGYDGDEFITQDPYILGANVRVSAATLEAAMTTVPLNTGAGQGMVLAA